MDNLYTVVHRDPVHTSNFTILNNRVLRDSKLSYQARFLHAWLLTWNPKEGFKFSADKISKSTKIPLARTKLAIKELQEAGYLKLTRLRDGQRYGFFRWDIYESPISDNTSEVKEVQNSQNVVITPEEQPVIISAKEFTYRQLFDQFWSVYPKQVDQENAYKAFCKIPNIEEVFPRIMTALEFQIKDKQWKEENGRFIPYPEKYIKQTRWEDVVIPDMEATKESMKEMMRILNYGTNN